MLWGGLLMLVGVLLLVLRLGRPAVRLGAVLAGVGSGFFIVIAGEPSAPPTWWQLLRMRALRAYDRAALTAWFPRVVLAVPIAFEPSDVTFPEWMQVAGSLAAAGLITEVFTFHASPGSATVGLAVDIVLLIALRIAGRHEAIMRDAG